MPISTSLASGSVNENVGLRDGFGATLNDRCALLTPTPATPRSTMSVRARGTMRKLPPEQCATPVRITTWPSAGTQGGATGGAGDPGEFAPSTPLKFSTKIVSG